MYLGIRRWDDFHLLLIFIILVEITGVIRVVLGILQYNYPNKHYQANENNNVTALTTVTFLYIESKISDTNNTYNNKWVFVTTFDT